MSDSDIDIGIAILYCLVLTATLIAAGALLWDTHAVAAGVCWGESAVILIKIGYLARSP
jgi:hypothetical protein